MKKFRTYLSVILVTLFLIVLLSSCGYSKKDEVRRNSATGEIQYVIWIYSGTDVLTSLRLPINDANCKNIDSLNKQADTLILKMKAAENCR